MTTVKEIYDALGTLIRQNSATANIKILAGGNTGELFVFRDKYMGNIKSVSFENKNISNIHPINKVSLNILFVILSPYINIT